jgi:NAD(P)-dependent dehydrogenase (short-subunit alcohol dehydrogenase family)
MEARYPLGIGTPSDVAKPCAFLLSDYAAWISGAQLLLDGGLMLNV